MDTPNVGRSDDFGADEPDVRLTCEDELRFFLLLRAEGLLTPTSS